MSSAAFKIMVFALLAGVVAFSCWRKPPLEKYREANEMGTELITIDVCLEKGAETEKTSRALDDVWQRMRDIYHRMSNWVEDSDIGKINRSYQNPQRVGQD